MPNAVQSRPKRPLVEEIVDRLLPHVRTLPSAAKSLAHICTVVPTAQAGRRLRLALARRLGACVPPLVKTPRGLLLDEDDPRLATRIDEIIAFRAALKSADVGRDLSPEVLLARARQLVDLRALLAPKALSFHDVAEALRVDLPEEGLRWQGLAELEKRFVDELSARGKIDSITAMKDFHFAPKEIEEIVLLDDCTAFAPVETASLVARQQIHPCATPADEAAQIADYFATVKPNEAWPALCVADPDFFPEIISAFKARGLSVHNPSKMRLVSSSLGHLVAQIVALQTTQSYAVFSSFVRSGDVRRWLASELRFTEEDLTAALVDLDGRQAEFLPEKVSDIAPKTQGKLRAIFEFVGVQLRKHGLRGILGSIFRSTTLDLHDPAAREFAAAAEVVTRLIDACGTDWPLLEMCLDEATYSLEPDVGDVILTDGWLELPFVEAEEVVIAGFREGCVPESTVGHPFLPDSLRHRLGLPDNAFKEARDRAILRQVVQSRTDEAVKIFFHAIDSNGETLKPSRLLFETADDTDLVSRVTAFYGTKAGTREFSALDLPRAWKLHLPIPPVHRTLEKISPTRLDSYLRCPFTYYLKDKSVLGDKRMDDRAEELQSWEYGNLAHEALEAFGLSSLKDSTDATQIRTFLEEKVDAQLVARFATSIPAIVALQGESVKRRLGHFAAIQAARRAEGWQIVAVEEKLEVAYDHTRLYGKCDRIDFNPQTGAWCVIDYKTWDKADKAQSFEKKRDGTLVWKSLQLPLYCAMLDVSTNPLFAAATREQISACYCVLGRTKDQVLFTPPFSGAYVPDAEACVRALIPQIERGVFWPPAPTREWLYDYEDWLSPTPEQTVDEAWIADQEARHG